ncbi:FAD-dependent oxidoreductase [Arthrobacter sp. NtRootA1]|uniref:NAD(P)/FAD-dependent oxidoreductase n=1 Tax=Arthrobacter sp. NtRootA1 TaxID=2830983 RepID=UPI001CC58D33|nr:FAD-dependent oxidoreductase [Arthrobacter sp. NtRootA1]BCW08027.1 glycine oxidase ThiO [Arthrobacter sp. NtRootA1]
MSQHDVAIIGAGVLAKATALELCKLGKSVVVFAPPELARRSASSAAGAMLGAFAEFTKGKDDFADRQEAELRIRSGRRWQSWYDEITDGISHEGGVRRGTFIVATNTGLEDVENVEFIQERASQFGEPHSWVDPRDVDGLNPHRLCRAQKVLALPNEGYIDSGVLRDAVDEALIRNPLATVVGETAVKVTIEGATPTVVSSIGHVYSAADLVVAAGAESTKLLRQLHLPFSLGVPELLGGKGVSAIVTGDLAFAGVLRTPNRDFACGTHIVPLGSGRTYLGATNRLETESFLNPRATLGELHSIAHSLSNEINVHFRTAEVTEIRAGYRPISSDGYPIYGQTAHPHVFVATGTYRNGILMAPEIARTVALEVAGSAPQPTNAFSPVERQKLFSDRDMEAIMLGSLKQVVSFMQEPDGNLPFNRAAELEGLLRAFLQGALNLEGGTELVALYRDLTDRYPISEAMPLLMYEVTQR